MSTALVIPATMGGPSALFAQSQVKPDDMAAGVGASFAILSMRGKNWRMKYRGEETTLMRPPVSPGGPPDGPRASVEVVIIKASPTVSKIYYAGGYKEGDTTPPDCGSADGIKPDLTSPNKQCETCAACPHNAWGSKMTEAGKAGKACADSKRLVVAPIEDLRNELFGGPILLRIPAASLGDMANYSNGLQAQGYPYFGVVTSLSFDLQVAYPKVVFTPVRALNDAEAAIVLELQNDPRTTRILSEAVSPPDEPKAVAPPVGVVAPAVAPAGNTGPSGAPTVMPAVAPTPAPVVVAPAPAPVVVAPAVDPYQYTPDGKHRWKAGMANWEPVPAPVVATPPPPPVVVAPPPAPVVVAPAAPVVVAPVAPTAPVEETAEQKIARLEAALAATPPAATGRGRGRRAATAPPSPAPTAVAEPANPPQAQAPVAAVASAPAVAPPIPTAAVAAGAAAISAIEQSLDDKLAALM